MPSERFTNEQIAFALRQAENGATVDEVCRKIGVFTERQVGGTALVAALNAT